MSERRDDSSYQVPGLERGLRLLEAFGRDNPEMTLAELTRKLELPRATAFRLVTTLERLGYLQKVSDRKAYRLGSRVLRLGFEYLASQDMVATAHAHLERLSKETGASAHLGVLDGTEVLYLDRVAGWKHLVSNVGIGTRFPAHATTMGRVLLAGLGDDTVRELYRNQALPRATPQTPGTIDELIRQLGSERNRGYAASFSGFEAGLSSVAAPVMNGFGRTVAAISLAGPDSQFDRRDVEGEIRRKVCGTAVAISAALGAAPPADGTLKAAE